MKSHIGKRKHRHKNYVQVLIRLLGKKNLSLKSKVIHVETANFEKVFNMVEKAIREAPE